MSSTPLLWLTARATETVLVIFKSVNNIFNINFHTYPSAIPLIPAHDHVTSEAGACFVVFQCAKVMIKKYNQRSVYIISLKRNVCNIVNL